ncbi:hypothetical protein ACOBQX_06625 [Actinokineospora sp. G85]|uniref:hypothetical protein n=1 Tax=Actinokineospora sp. G85 TaxID=3406626 RepID=UPI003C70C8AA
MGFRNGAGRRATALAAAGVPVAPGTVRAWRGRLTGAVSTATAGPGNTIEVVLANTR